jgi:hypothetical protein
MIGYRLTNNSRFPVNIEFSPAGHTGRLAPGQWMTARSPVQGGRYPKVKAIASKGSWWERTI